MSKASAREENMLSALGGIRNAVDQTTALRAQNAELVRENAAFKETLDEMMKSKDRAWSEVVGSERLKQNARVVELVAALEQARAFLFATGYATPVLEAIDAALLAAGQPQGRHEMIAAEEPFPGSPDDMMNTVASLRAQNAELVAALEALLHAVCGETGFANAVRTVTETAYPWPALDLAEERARAALVAARQPQGSGE